MIERGKIVPISEGVDQDDRGNEPTVFARCNIAEQRKVVVTRNVFLLDMEVIFYRSSQRGTSWITTAGAILDACALFSSTVDRQDVPWLNLCFLAGSRTLRDIATVVGIPIGPSLASSAPIHVTRAEYDAAYEQLRSAGVPLKADRDESWHAFVSMRSRYGIALIALAHLVYAPKAPWSSDRKLGITARDLIR